MLRRAPLRGSTRDRDLDDHCLGLSRRWPTLRPTLLFAQMTVASPGATGNADG